MPGLLGFGDADADGFFVGWDDGLFDGDDDEPPRGAALGVTPRPWKGVARGLARSRGGSTRRNGDSTTGASGAGTSTFSTGFAASAFFSASVVSPVKSAPSMRKGAARASLVGSGAPMLYPPRSRPFSLASCALPPKTS
ncbi:MAG: hypothetical protein ACT6ST_13940, partial [Microbacterium aurantiacum]